MLYQIHWQDRDDLRKTEFVAQGEIKDEGSFLKTWAFFQEAMIRSLQNGNRPGDNWVPLITPIEAGYGPFKVAADYMRKHKPVVGGYYVKYKDGYASFSPADAFEDGYTKIS